MQPTTIGQDRFEQALIDYSEKYRLPAFPDREEIISIHKTAGRITWHLMMPESWYLEHGGVFGPDQMDTAPCGKHFSQAVMPQKFAGRLTYRVCTRCIQQAGSYYDAEEIQALMDYLARWFRTNWH